MPDLCGGTHRPWDLNTTEGNSSLAAALNTALFAAFNGSLASNEAAVYCATNANICLGICPNADVTGVGVRVAFYLNAILTAMLVGLSPNDSASAAWSSTILTMSLVIPAVIQKKQGALTLYHATLVLNFATFSSISSLAVAPLCTVWRQIDNKDHPRYNKVQTPNLRSIPLPISTSEETYHQDAAMQLAKTTTIPQRRRSRVILSLALIAQVSLQWAWATYLFTSPYYAQQACNAYTTVVLFGVPMTAYKVNHHYFGLWASWLLFSIVVTLIFGVLLVISSTSGANSNKMQRRQLRLRKTSWLADRITDWDPKGDKRRLINFVTAFVICSLLVIFSEMQVNRNCVFGENSQWGFGQLAALLFALAPVWSIVESERGQHLAKQLPGMFKRKDNGSTRRHAGNTEPAPLGHYRDGSSEPLLLNGEHSPEYSPNSSDPDSPGRMHAVSPIHSTADPFHLTPSSSTFSRDLMSNARLRSASVYSFPQSSITAVGHVAINLTPPSREASRGPSRSQSPVDLTDTGLPPHLGGLGGHSRL
ncbi:hypothetical protein PILCRDRAFT_819493 [Piloderma croceum F 1598]|uniref:Uncharacterized protein n=1 Tax=Piloderma croceum (strain F 1598) TaxID=765440 RepID=A0A0C3FFP4_PILCF|nr:hypothetical protein PILCRDRAFT_819493 [Piloderma croceum F 1598]